PSEGRARWHWIPRRTGSISSRRASIRRRLPARRSHVRGRAWCRVRLWYWWSERSDLARPLAASTRDGDRLHENVGEHLEGKLCLAEWRRYLNAGDHWPHAREHLVGDGDTGHFVREEFRVSN